MRTLRLSKTAIFSMFLLCFLTSLQSCRVTLPPYSEEARDLPQKAHAVVTCEKIEKDSNELISRTGAGIIFSIKQRVYIITSAHACEDLKTFIPFSKKRVTVTIGEREDILAREERVRPNGLDITILSVERAIGKTSERAVPLAPRRPRRFTKAFVFGYSSTNPRKKIVGRIGGITKSRVCRTSQKTVDCFTFIKGVVPGFSGGGVYGPSHKLIGMCIARRRSDISDEKRGICFSIDALRPYMKEYL